MIYFIIGLNKYWIASRCCYANSEKTYCCFEVRCANSTRVYGPDLYFSDNGTNDTNSKYESALRPIIELSQNSQVIFEGESDNTGYYLWKMQ